MCGGSLEDTFPFVAKVGNNSVSTVGTHTSVMRTNQLHSPGLGLSCLPALQGMFECAWKTMKSATISTSLEAFKKL